jgi:hypothetical protein
VDHSSILSYFFSPLIYFSWFLDELLLVYFYIWVQVAISDSFSDRLLYASVKHVRMERILKFVPEISCKNWRIINSSILRHKTYIFFQKVKLY